MPKGNVLPDLPNIVGNAFEVPDFHRPATAGLLTSHYSERKEAVAKLEERVGLTSI
jgi:hypothetical protein